MNEALERLRANNPWAKPQAPKAKSAQALEAIAAQKARGFLNKPPKKAKAEKAVTTPMETSMTNPANETIASAETPSLEEIKRQAARDKAREYNRRWLAKKKAQQAAGAPDLVPPKPVPVSPKPTKAKAKAKAAHTPAASVPVPALHTVTVKNVLPEPVTVIAVQPTCTWSIEFSEELPDGLDQVKLSGKTRTGFEKAIKTAARLIEE